jgi:hypothetical protein
VKPLYVSVNGTGVPDPYGPGFAGDIGRALTDPWNDIMSQFWGKQFANVFDWQPVGYDAAVMSMDKSARGAVYRKPGTYSPDDTGGIVAQVLARPKGTKHALGGYSQGAIATGICLKECYLDKNGPLHDRLPDLLGSIHFGDPLRTPGLARGNEIAKLPAPKKQDGQTTGGIAGPGCLTAAESELVISCALDGDLYASAPVGDDPWHNEPLVGQIETRIYHFIQTGSIVDGFMAVMKGIAQEFGHPLSNTIALFHAISNGVSFAAEGTSAPHWQYAPFVPAMVEWLLSRV